MSDTVNIPIKDYTELLYLVGEVAKLRKNKAIHKTEILSLRAKNKKLEERVKDLEYYRRAGRYGDEWD